MPRMSGVAHISPCHLKTGNKCCHSFPTTIRPMLEAYAPTARLAAAATALRRHGEAPFTQQNLPQLHQLTKHHKAYSGLLSQYARAPVQAYCHCRNKLSHRCVSRCIVNTARLNSSRGQHDNAAFAAGDARAAQWSAMQAVLSLTATIRDSSSSCAPAANTVSHVKTAALVQTAVSQGCTCKTACSHKCCVTCSTDTC